eukprot:CAMPEP_0171779624 /NCGR_PEP_ID=MMETSP0991-20121206/59116_1 /TAXON_ID=483369 /ORGANISM="non described non described, Strain CCMP2098" /LENGTH=61 /DNA_ID=CAMNT_0012386821 /DNA_START=57 /DNA_END=240 /DNA_ORIENTATION=-
MNQATNITVAAGLLIGSSGAFRRVGFSLSRTLSRCWLSKCGSEEDADDDDDDDEETEAFCF